MSQNDEMTVREVMVLITGANKSIALYKAVEEGVCHMWTVSAFQMHNNTLMVCDEDATLELRVRTVKYFKVIINVYKIYLHKNHDIAIAMSSSSPADTASVLTGGI